MDKIPFQISAVKKGKVAEIKIIGQIGWDVNSSVFRMEVEDLVKDGCTEAHLYINSPGGSCFDANEISNILHDNFKKITGDGGALVASAAAFLAEHCDSFSMPANGQFMVHRPSGCACGTAAQIESYLKLIKDLDNDYLELFKAKAKDKENFQSKWNSGADYWMNAKEAIDAGFITSVREKVKIDKETKDMIRACAEVKDHLAQLLTNIDMKEVAKLLKLPESASEQDVINMISPIIAENQTLKADLQKEKDEKKVVQDKLEAKEAAEKAARATKAEALVNEAIKDGRLADDEKHASKNFWMKLFESDFDGTSAELSKLPKHQSVRSQVTTGASGESAWVKRQKEIEEANKGK